MFNIMPSLTRKRKSNEFSSFDKGPDRFCYITDERMEKLNNYIDDDHIVLLQSPPEKKIVKFSLCIWDLTL